MISPELLEKLSSAHSDNPQKAGLVGHWMGELAQCLRNLAGLGHHLQVIEADAAELHQFPKMLYHSDNPPTVVMGEEEEKTLLDAGWRTTPEIPGESPAPEPEVTELPPVFTPLAPTGPLSHIDNAMEAVRVKSPEELAAAASPPAPASNLEPQPETAPEALAPAPESV